MNRPRIRPLPPGRLRRKARAAERRRKGKLFWGSLALLLFILCGFLAYRLTHPDAPCSYNSIVFWRLFVFSSSTDILLLKL